MGIKWEPNAYLIRPAYVSFHKIAVKPKAMTEPIQYIPVFRSRIAASIQRANISSCISLVEISSGALLYGGALSACLSDRMV
jgi:hypothetical protein